MWTAVFGRRAHSARDDCQIERFAVGFVPFERRQLARESANCSSRRRYCLSAGRV